MSITSHFALAATIALLSSAFPSFQANAMNPGSGEDARFSLNASGYIACSVREERGVRLLNGIDFQAHALPPIAEDIVGEAEGHYKSLKHSQGPDSKNTKIARWEWKLAKAIDGKNSVLAALSSQQNMRDFLESYVKECEGRDQVKEEKNQADIAQKLRGKVAEVRTNLHDGEGAMRLYIEEIYLPEMELHIQKLEGKIQRSEL